MKAKKIFGFSQNVIVLSLVSFLNDIGGETIKKTIPLYLANILGAKTEIIGLIEGVAESTPQLFQPLSGFLSDYLQKRKPLVVIGQILRSFMLFLFWATTWPQILLLRFLDRSGKGIANAPRDALVSGSAEDRHVGAAFGLTRMFDNGGAVVGLLLAAAIVFFTRQSSLILTPLTFHRIVLLAVLPLLLSLVLLIFWVRDVTVPPKVEKFTWANALGGKFYLFLLLSFIFTLGNSSDAFLILKAQQTGMAIWQIFILLAAYSLVSSLSGLPLSSLSDRIGRKKLLVIGWLLYSTVYFFFARNFSMEPIILLFLVYGLYYGLTEGSARALVADIVVKNRQGTAYGIYNMVTGFTLFPASLIAGYLWQAYQPATAFYFGSAMSLAAAVGLILLF